MNAPEGGEGARGWRATFSTGRVVMACLLVCGVLVVESGLRAPAVSRGPPVVVPVPSVGTPLVDDVRETPFRWVANERSAAVVSGVVFGRADRIASADRDRFLRTGLWHLLAASGQNVALVVALCAGIAAAVGGSRSVGVWVAAVVVPLYVMVVGEGASIVRAGLMAELALILWLAGRLRDGWHAVLASGALIVWVWPGAHRSLGFQLSYACVVALLAWCGPLVRWLELRGVPRVLGGPVGASLLCSAATAPLLALRTGEVPLAGVLANLPAVPLASAILLVGLPSALAGMVVPKIGMAGMQLAAWLARGLLGTADVAARLPLASTDSLVFAVAAPLGWAGWWALRQLGAERHARMAAAAAAALIAADTAATWARVPEGPRAGAARIVVLDVGQGDATVLQSMAGAVLVDTGPPQGHVDRAAHRAGVRRVDGIVVTHDSLDHRGGLTEAVASLRPGWIAIPRAAPGEWRWVRRLGPRVVEVCAGHMFRLGGLGVQVLHPPCGREAPTLTGDPHNDNAVVLLAQVGRIRALLSSDAEAPVTSRLQLGRIDLLRVAHHGSRDPALGRLLDDIAPDVAAISVGEDNAYGHPTPSTLAALSRARVPMMRTDRDGTVIFETDGSNLWRR